MLRQIQCYALYSFRKPSTNRVAMSSRRSAAIEPLLTAATRLAFQNGESGMAMSSPAKALATPDTKFENSPSVKGNTWD